MERSRQKRLEMREEQIVVKAFGADCRKGGKKEKGAILDRFVQLIGCERRFAARALSF